MNFEGLEHRYLQQYPHSLPGENVDIVEDIYVPALQNSNLHKRLTFSFSSQGLVELAIGLEKFIENEGEMHLIIGSPISYPDMK